jgi:hypothetical protein
MRPAALFLHLRLVLRVGCRRQFHVDALLEHRRNDHHDDQQNQHDVDKRRDVDVGLDVALAAQLHCHGALLPAWKSGRRRIAGPVSPRFTRSS